MSTKKSRNKQHHLRILQRKVLETVDSAASAVSNLADNTMDALQKLDKAAGISKKAQDAGDKVRETATELDNRYGLMDKTDKVTFYTRNKAEKAANAVKELAEKSGAMDLANQTTQQVRETLLAPAKGVISATGIDQKIGNGLNLLEKAYGDTREFIKPYFAAKDLHELLKNTRRELTSVSACIMQISSNDSEKLANQFGSAVLAKATGAAATTTLLALVAAYGTAGTGTAIASLSGAAAANATLAWVGSLLGGGMAAGAVLTGGISLVAGLAAYKLLGSEHREFKSLTEVEQRIVQTCWLSIAIIDEYLANSPEQLAEQEAELLLSNIYRPLLKELEVHQEAICAHLDGKHAIAFRQHVLTDFRRVVIEDFENYIDDYVFKGFAGAEYAIGGVLYALLSQSAISSDVESQLVLDALRRSSKALANASEGELGEYLRDLSPDALRGLAANVKGIYHELLYVHNYNTTHSETRAEIFSLTNYPGADIQILDATNGELIDQIQLKAVMEAAKIAMHLDKYPDISVLATNEVAYKFTDSRVSSSGYDNEALQAKVQGDLGAVADNTIESRVGEATLMAAGISSTRELLLMLRGERVLPDAALNVLKGSGTAATASAFATFLFG